jgi:hypothetical protein
MVFIESILNSQIFCFVFLFFCFFFFFPFVSDCDFQTCLAFKIEIKLLKVHFLKLTQYIFLCL